MRYDLHRHPASSHQRILRILLADPRSPILDVGCAHGTIGALLADARGAAVPAVDGIEPDPAWAAEARPWYRTLHVGRVEDAALVPGTYAQVVLADVLEHLPDPAGTLRDLRVAAHPDARFVISVPNVAHLAARLLLLAGRWPRMERGIFDRTHLHFWTRDTFAELLAEAGLRAERWEATPVPLEQVWPDGRLSWLRAVGMRIQTGCVRVLPRVFGFQWIVVAVADGAPATVGDGRGPA